MNRFFGVTRATEAIMATKEIIRKKYVVRLSIEQGRT
jgi:hypothetical protein